MQPLALPSYTSLGSVITEDLDFYDAKNAAAQAGWEYLGSGATATAYKSPCGNRVLKVVNNDDGNRATLDAAIAHPDNPHLPTVYGLLDLDDGAFAVELEVLEPGGGEHSKWESTWSPGRGVNVSDTLPAFIEEAEDCPMKAAIKALHSAALGYPEICWDCHGGNLMIRPGTGELVLNDLLYGEAGNDYSPRECCEKCARTFSRYDGAFVDDVYVCPSCFEDAIQCGFDDEYHFADEDDAVLLDCNIRFWGDNVWTPQEGHIAACNREAAEADGYIWDEAGQRYVEPKLHAVLSAIEGIAREVEADLIQPRLPFALAA